MRSGFTSPSASRFLPHTRIHRALSIISGSNRHCFPRSPRIEPASATSRSIHPTQPSIRRFFIFRTRFRSLFESAQLHPSSCIFSVFFLRPSRRRLPSFVATVLATSDERGHDTETTLLFSVVRPCILPGVSGAGARAHTQTRASRVSGGAWGEQGK